MTSAPRLADPSVSSFFSRVLGIFCVPFDGLPLVMWCYFVISYVALPHNPVWGGTLPDPDDYTYLTQTLDWLRGQGWFDTTQYRMAPPEGVAIHYTRFAELPIAGLILAFRALHYSWRGAALLASFILPLLTLGIFFKVLSWSAATILGSSWARLSAYVVMFAPALMFKFAPGQVDHHGVEAMATILGVGLTAKMFEAPDKLIWPLLAGSTFALTVAVALETLPWMMLTSVVVGLWVAFDGRTPARAAALFGLSLVVTGAACLALEKPFATMFHRDLLAYSCVYVELMAGIALTLALVALSTRISSVCLRWTFVTVVASALAGSFLWCYPDLLGGPYGAMDQRLAALFFSNLEEAQPILDRYGIGRACLLLGTSLLAMAATIFFCCQKAASGTWSWRLLCALLLGALALTVGYQIRVLIYALLFSVIPLTALLKYGWTQARLRMQTDRRRFWAEIALVLSVGPLTAVLLPAIQDGRSFNAGVLLFPAQTFDDSCQMRDLSAFLNAAPYSDRVFHILNMMDEGPQMLFDTRHSVVSAPYHMNVSGNLDALDFFQTTDFSKAREIAARNKIDLVVFCKNVPDMYFHEKGPHFVRLPDGQVKMRPDPSLVGQLMEHKPPDWLREIPLASSSNYLVFEPK